MAVGAYASVLTLMRSLDNALLPPRCNKILPNKPRIEELQENFSSLQESLELHSSLVDDPTIEQIRQVVIEADDVVDKFVVDGLRIIGASLDDDELDEIERSSFCRDIEELIRRTESINQGLIASIEERDHSVAVRPLPKPSSYVDSSSDGSNTLVGFEDHTEKIMVQLVGRDPNLQIIPIVGMGGTGKTTLARHVFDSKLIKEHFDVRIWLTISQEYDDAQKILMDLKRKGVVSGDDADLGTSLYQKLFGRRYLIVMDDVWSDEAWNGLTHFFPRGNNRSRIVITTRLSNLANSLAPPDNCYSIGLLDEDKSWTLFREKSRCSDELEEIGKKIAKQCGGLPLALVVMGGLMAKSNGTLEYWEKIANKMDSFVESEMEEKCLSTLYVSYDHLPIHLKPCFLYMGVFPEDSDILVKRLIESWVAEGIVRPMRGTSMEDAAMGYLEDLIGRNMVLVRKLGNLRKFRICGIHDLMRLICIKETSKERFLSVPTRQDIPHEITPQQTYPGNVCLVCGKYEVAFKRIQLCAVVFGSRSMTQTSHNKVCDVCSTKHPRLNGSTSVKLIDEIDCFQPLDIPPQVTKLRSLFIGDVRSVPIVLASPFPICLLWNLQVFNLDGCGLPLSKIWAMPQLRHVRADIDALPDPVDTDDMAVLQHMHTLTRIRNFRCTEEVVRRLPNLVKLALDYDDYSFRGERRNWSYYCLNNLELLRNLQSLSVRCTLISLDIKSISFPQSLKKLSLSGGEISWEDMDMIGSLPNLEVLKLSYDAIVGDEWCTVEGQFPRLKCLSLGILNLVIWRSESSHFPVLENLELRLLEELEEFPLDIGDINTLLSIQVEECSECIEESVSQIAEEQENNGNVLTVDMYASAYEDEDEDEDGEEEEDEDEDSEEEDGEEEEDEDEDGEEEEDDDEDSEEEDGEEEEEDGDGEEER